jgi:hypothetical protein
VALVLLQRSNQLFHLRRRLFVLNGQQHAGFDIHKVRRHGDKLTGNLQIKLLPLVHPLDVLVENEGNLDILDFHFIFAEQVQNQIQRAVEVLHVLFGVHHVLQVIYRCVQTLHLNIT